MGSFFVRRPVFAIVIAIVTVVLGGVSILGLPMEKFPDITPPVVEVSASYGGASAISVEQSVATPLEQELNGVDNMIYMKSTNANDGSSVIKISFEVGSDPDMNTVFTQNRVAAAMAKLPPEVGRSGVKTEKAMSSILMIITLTSDGRYDQNFLGNYALINIKDVLSRLPGIGRVSILGASNYSMRIWVRPDKLAQLNLAVQDIVQAVRKQSQIVPGGKLGAEPAPPGTEFTYTVRLPDRLQSPEEFGEIVIRSTEKGAQIKLKDVARIELGAEQYTAFTRLNGKEAAIIALYQAPGSNAVELVETAKNTMDELSQSFPSGVTYDVSIDSSKPITAGIKEVINTLFEALILVLLVVFIFIQDWRAALIPTLAICVSLVGTFMLFPLLGFSINVLSLLGLVLAIGIVVDDAIVVVEAVQVNIEKGMSPKEATIEAMKEVTGPIIATTLVLVAVFIPVAAMAGITGKLYQQFAITIAVSVLISSINALTLSPALCSLLLRKPAPIRGPLGFFFKWFNIGFNKITDQYMKVATAFARRLVIAVATIAIFFAATWLISVKLPGGFMPQEDMGYLFVNMQLPDAASLQRSDVVAKNVEKIISTYPEVEYVTTVTGYSLLSGAMSTNTGFIFMALKDWDKRVRTADDITHQLNEDFAAEIKAAEVFAFGPSAIPGLGSGSGFTMFLQDRVGSTPDYLNEQALNFAKAAQDRPEIESVRSTFRPAVPQKFISINRDKALAAGINLDDIDTALGAFLGGYYINDFNKFGRMYKAYLQAEPEFRQKEENIKQFYVRNNDGEMVPLAAFVNISDTYGPEFTNRFNLMRAVELSGGAAPGYTSSQVLQVLEEVAVEVLPADMGYAWADMSYQEKKASGSAVIIFAFSLFFVYLILAAQYESWSLPAAILLGTPFALLGAMGLLLLARTFDLTYENNIFAQISLVLLIAMAAKNAILIIEFAYIEFKKGKNLLDAALESARLRFRPIVMTSLAFMLGVLPLVLASGSGSETRQVMGMALIGGMSLATLLGVFYYPMLFVFIGRIAGYEKKRDSLTE